MTTATRTSMMNTTANTTNNTVSAYLRTKSFYKDVTELAVKEVRIRTVDCGYFTKYDRELLRDIIVEKCFKYLDSFDPSIAKLKTLVGRIAHNVIADYKESWFRRERVTMSLDRMLGWSGESEDDSESYSAPSTFYQEASERFRDTGAEAVLEAKEWEENARRAISGLSAGDQRVIAMLEDESSREDIAVELGCNRNAADKRVHDTRERAMKAVGCKVVRSRKARRETAETSVDLPFLFFTYGCHVVAA